MNNTSLLELYKAEKADMDDPICPVHPFTGEFCEEFPTFPEWKKMYMDIQAKHRADFPHHRVPNSKSKTTEQIVDMTLEELENVTSSKENTISTREEVTMKKENTAKKAVAKKAIVKKAVAKKATTTTTKLSAKKSATKTVTKKPVAVKSKMTEAKAIFKRMMKHDGSFPTRHDVLVKFAERLNMSEKGGSTYYYNIKRQMTMEQQSSK